MVRGKLTILPILFPAFPGPPTGAALWKAGVRAASRLMPYRGVWTSLAPLGLPSTPILVSVELSIQGLIGLNPDMARVGLGTTTPGKDPTPSASGRAAASWIKEATRRRHTPKPPHRELRPAPEPRHCSCGVCPFCVESARWEKIFNEKFADPDYYKERNPRFGSSLSWL